MISNDPQFWFSVIRLLGGLAIILAGVVSDNETAWMIGLIFAGVETMDIGVKLKRNGKGASARSDAD